MRKHYCGNSEYDEALCGEPQLDGGELYIQNVTCYPCLNKLIEMGKQASEQKAQLESQCATKPQCECH